MIRSRWSVLFFLPIETSGQDKANEEAKDKFTVAAAAGIVGTRHCRDTAGVASSQGRLERRAVHNGAKTSRSS